MATHCPECNRKLSFLDWRQTCPDCGTNLMFYGFAEKFFDDAKYAEMGNAKVRVWWAKVIACFFGGKLQIMRLCFIVLPLAAMLLPMCTLHLELPLFSRDISLGIIGAVSAFSDGTITTAFSVGEAAVTGIVADALRKIYIVFAGMLLCEVLTVLFQLLCFLSTKVMTVLLCISSAVGICVSLYGAFAVKGLIDAVSSFDTMFSVSSGFGNYIVAAAFMALFIVNVILAVKGINIKYKEGDLYRVEVSKKLKHGEIRIDELSQPIFETDEEKVAREEAIEHTMNGTASEDKKEEGNEQ